MDPSSREFDVVILGASGFTGKYVVRETLKFLSAPGSPIRTLALAGRNPTKLSQTLAWASSSSSIPLIRCDVSSTSSLIDLAKRTSLLLNCVGPFHLYGAPVVSACVATGTDYLDITGEPQFMERMEADHHSSAVQSGSLVVCACGIDSVPADLGLLFNSRQWKGPAAPNRVEAYLLMESDKRIVGNIGTYASAVLMFSSVASLLALRRSSPRPARLAIPGPVPSKGSVIEHNKTLGLWAVKLPSADSMVVRRTLAALMDNPGGLPGVEESEEYKEQRKKFWSSVKPAHFGVKLCRKSILGVLRLMWMGFFIGVFGVFSFGRLLLLKFPKMFTLGMFSKTGPTEEEVQSATFKLWFVGHGYSDTRTPQARAMKPDTEIITRISGPEIGYVTTPIILVQCAMVVLAQRRNLPKGGVYTPGIVFGPTDLQERLQANGISFDLVSKKSLVTNVLA